MDLSERTAAGAEVPTGRRRPLRSGPQLTGWLLALPALAFYAVFALWPLVGAVRYSLYDWNGVGAARWVGVGNYTQILTDPELLKPVRNAALLLVFFTAIPVGVGLVLASLLRAVRHPVLAGLARTVLFLPQVVPLAAAGIAWSWMYAQTGAVNQVLDAIGLRSFSRPWLGDFDTALPAVGLVGSWVLTGLCTVLLLTGMSKIDPALYESVRMDGGGWYWEFRDGDCALPAARARRPRRRDDDRRAGQLRHRLQHHERWAGRRHDGTECRDLPAWLRRA